MFYKARLGSTRISAVRNPGKNKVNYGSNDSANFAWMNQSKHTGKKDPKRAHHSDKIQGLRLSLEKA